MVGLVMDCVDRMICKGDLKLWMGIDCLFMMLLFVMMKRERELEKQKKTAC